MLKDFEKAGLPNIFDKKVDKKKKTKGNLFDDEDEKDDNQPVIPSKKKTLQEDDEEIPHSRFKKPVEEEPVKKPKIL